MPSTAYTDASRVSRTRLDREAQLRRGIAAVNSKRTADAIAALNSIPSSASELRAEALFYLTQAYADGASVGHGAQHD